MFHKNEVSQKRIKPRSGKQGIQQKREEMKFLLLLENQTDGTAGAPSVSSIAGDFIPKAAGTELFPKKASATVYKKGRIAQLQSQESYPTCL